MKKSFSDEDPSDAPRLARPLSGVNVCSAGHGKVPLKTRRGKGNGNLSDAMFGDEVIEYNYRRHHIELMAHSQQFFKELPRYNLVKYRVNKSVLRNNSFNKR